MVRVCVDKKQFPIILAYANDSHYDRYDEDDATWDSMNPHVKSPKDFEISVA